MLEVHEQELLVLLLVVAAQFEQLQPPLVDPARLEGRHHLAVDPRAEVPDLRHARSGDEAPLGPGLPRAHGLVVGVEQEPEDRLGRGVPGQPAQDELLEEPGGVRAVPGGGAGRGHGLRDLVLGAEPGGQPVGEAADPEEPPDRGLGGRCGGDVSDGHGFPRGSWSAVGRGRRSGCRQSNHAGRYVTPLAVPPARPRRGCGARAPAAGAGGRGSGPSRRRRGSRGARG